MLAVFKNKLVVKFDQALQDAKDSDCHIVCFKLESEEENMMLHAYHDLCDVGWLSKDPGIKFEYQNVVIHEFVPGKITTY